MSTEITKKTVDFLAVVPDHLREVKGHEGMENVNKNDLILPRLAICQGNNPQRKKANPLYIEGLEDGDLFNTVTNEVYGNKLQFIPLLKTGSRILFGPSGGGWRYPLPVDEWHRWRQPVSNLRHMSQIQVAG